MKFVNKNILLSLKLFVTTMQLLSLSSFIFFISFNFPQKTDNATIVFISFIFFISFNFPKKEVANEMLSRKRDSNP